MQLIGQTRFVPDTDGRVEQGRRSTYPRRAVLSVLDDLAQRSKIQVSGLLGQHQVQPLARLLAVELTQVVVKDHIRGGGRQMDVDDDEPPPLSVCWEGVQR
ncbi:MAG: hypothetical protein JWR48_6469 [Mycobacterium sp.]|jgi:hypothetical protein|nr:hypothetical protein [Mycobacterium sp.]